MEHSGTFAFEFLQHITSHCGLKMFCWRNLTDPILGADPRRFYLYFLVKMTKKVNMKQSFHYTGCFFSSFGLFLRSRVIYIVEDRIVNTFEFSIQISLLCCTCLLYISANSMRGKSTYLMPTIKQQTVLFLFFLP